MNELPTGTVTFLFTDIEGSTRLVEELGERYVQVLHEQRRQIRAAADEHRGQEVDSQGDGLLFAFPQAKHAIAAAAAAQRTLAEGPVRVRIGIHSGEPVLTSEGYVGLELHRAARICQAAHGGQVLVSKLSAELGGRELEDGVSLRSLGAHRLKDLSEPTELYQLALQGLTSEFPPLRTLEQAATNLPVQPTPLVGRERELEEAEALLEREDVRLLTLTGPGGTGKTRLALQLAAEVLERFEHGVYAVALAPIADSDLVLPTAAQALRLREQPGVPIAETLADYLGQKQILIMLDNFEQVLEAAPALAALLTRAPKLKLVVTSRAPLHLSGEREYPVPPLLETEAVTLFTERAQAVKREFELTQENEQAVRAICERLDGLPLALELAAARIRMLPPASLLERLEQRLPLLTGGARDLDERQQTLRATIEWSYELLSEQEQTLFARLAVFVGGCTLEAAEQVCGEGIDVFEGLSSLVEQSLVRQRESATGEPRFSMLQTIREYAGERLEQSGEAEEVRDRHAAHFALLAEMAEPHVHGEDVLPWANVLDADLDNLRASITWSIERRQAERALRQASALWFFWDLRGYIGEGRELLRAALASGADAPAALRARALARAGNLAWCEGALDQAVMLSEQADALAGSIGDEVERAFARADLSWVAVMQGDDATAAHLGEEAVALARTARSPWLARTLTVLGSAFQSGDLARAEELFEESLRVSREARSTRDIGMSLGNLGEAALIRGDYARTIELTEEANAIARRLDDPRYLTYGVLNLGLAALHLGDHRAADALAEAVELCARTRDRYAAANVLRAVSALAAEIGLAERAAVISGAAEALLESMRAKPEAATRPLEESIAKAQERLGTGAFEAAGARGRAMTFDEALEYALATANEALEHVRAGDA